MVERSRLMILAALSGLPLALNAMAAGRDRPGVAVADATKPSTSGVGRFVHYEPFPARRVQPRDVMVWLPPDYDSDEVPCSVLYVHDGQNLFAPADPLGHGPWDVDKHLLALRAAGKIRRTLVVGIFNTGLNRSREYGPAAAIGRLAPALQSQIAGSSADGAHSPLSDQYLGFITEELKPFIDRNYRTRPGPADTLLMGSSMGGLISLYGLALCPELFGAAACLSTHWPLTTNYPWLFPAVDARVPDIAGAFLDWLAARLPEAGTHRLYFDHGTENLDSLYAPYQERMDAIARTKGYRDGIDYLSRVFPGQDHNEEAWRQRLAIPLEFLLRPSG